MAVRTDFRVVESPVPAEDFGGNSREKERQVRVFSAGSAGAGKEA